MSSTVCHLFLSLNQSRLLFIICLFISIYLRMGTYTQTQIHTYFGEFCLPKETSTGHPLKDNSRFVHKRRSIEHVSLPHEFFTLSWVQENNPEVSFLMACVFNTDDNIQPTEAACTWRSHSCFCPWMGPPEGKDTPEGPTTHWPGYVSTSWSLIFERMRVRLCKWLHMASGGWRAGQRRLMSTGSLSAWLASVPQPQDASPGY